MIDLGRTLADEAKSRATLARLAERVRDHQHMATLLTSAPPHLRQTVYDVLRANIHFKALPLDVYIARAGERAEREQWPVMEENGLLREFKAAPVKTIDALAQEALGKELAEQVLTLTCSKCTGQESFHKLIGESRLDVIVKSRRAGWVYNAETDREICPKCPTSLRADA